MEVKVLTMLKVFVLPQCEGGEQMCGLNVKIGIGRYVSKRFLYAQTAIPLDQGL